METKMLKIAKFLKEQKGPIYKLLAENLERLKEEDINDLEVLSNNPSVEDARNIAEKRKSKALKALEGLKATGQKCQKLIETFRNKYGQ